MVVSGEGFVRIWGIFFVLIDVVEDREKFNVMLNVLKVK